MLEKRETPENEGEIPQIAEEKLESENETEDLEPDPEKASLSEGISPINLVKDEFSSTK